MRTELDSQHTRTHHLTPCRLPLLTPTSSRVWKRVRACTTHVFLSPDCFVALAFFCAQLRNRVTRCLGSCFHTRCNLLWQVPEIDPELAALYAETDVILDQDVDTTRSMVKEVDEMEGVATKTTTELHRQGGQWTHAHTHARTHERTYTHARTHACTHTRTQCYAYAHAHARARAHTRTHARIHARIYTHTLSHTHPRTLLCRVRAHRTAARGDEINTDLTVAEKKLTAMEA
jgi:hypothetical protein